MTTSIPNAATALRVRCRLFGRYAELAGVAELDLTLPRGATVARVVDTVRARVAPGAIPLRPMVAVNLEHALADRRLADGDEVALLPPLAGG